MIANSTSEKAVFRSDGIQLYGLDAELELKMQGKRDKSYEKELGKWIEQVSGVTLDHEDIADALKSGIVLCKLLNAIQPGTVKNINTRPIALMEVENIQLYLKGCWDIGVPTSDLFVTSDLYQKKGIPQVIQNIVSLSRVAQTLPSYKGPPFGAKLSVPAPVKKWETIETNQVVYATDLQTPKATQANICMECGAAKKHLAKICDKCGADMSKQSNDVAHIIAALQETKKELALAQTRYQKADEENKKLLEQLKQTAEKLNTLSSISPPSSRSSSPSRAISPTPSPRTVSPTPSPSRAISPSPSRAISPSPSRAISPTPSRAFSPIKLRTGSNQETNNKTDNTTDNKTNNKTGILTKFRSGSNAPAPTPAVTANTSNNTNNTPNNTTTTNNNTKSNVSTSNTTNNTTTKQNPITVQIIQKTPAPQNDSNRPLSPSPVKPTAKTQTMTITVPAEKTKPEPTKVLIEPKEDKKLKEELEKIEKEKAKLEQEIATLKQNQVGDKKTKAEVEKYEKEKMALEQEKAKVEQEKARVEQEKAKVEQEKANLAKEKTTLEQEKTKLAKLGQDKTKVAQAKSMPKDSKSTPDLQAVKTKAEMEKYEKEKAKLEQEKAKAEQEKANLSKDNSKLEQEKAKLAQEKANLAKDNNKLAVDYQTLERKYREEVGKAKTADEKVKVLEKKLELAGLTSMQNVKPGQPPQRPIAQGKLVSEGRYRPTLEKTLTRRHIGKDLQKRLTMAPLDEVFDLDIGLDEDMIRYSRDCMAQILFSKPIEFADVYALNDLFSTDTGRRRFTQIMQSSMKEIPTLILSDNSFELLLYLINTILQQMDLSDSKDLIGAKVLMKCASSLSRIENGTHHFVRDFIKSYELWKDLNFWEEYFWDTLAKKHRKKYQDNIKNLDKELTLQLISSFAYNMLNWGVSKEKALFFTREMAARNTISKQDIEHIEGIINAFNLEDNKTTKFEETFTQHKFVDKHFSKLTWCTYCKEFIWGVTSKQGYKCEACKCKIHKRCLKDAQANLQCFCTK